MQHAVLWPLLVYVVPMTTIEELEKTISQFLWRWLRLTQSLSSIALHGHSTKLHLPLSRLTEEFKVTLSRKVMMYRYSANGKVASAGIFVLKVLKALADSICTAVQNSKSQVALKQSITFIKAGQKANHQPNSSGGLLSTGAVTGSS